jgi:hypothetical protein
MDPRSLSFMLGAWDIVLGPYKLVLDVVPEWVCRNAIAVSLGWLAVTCTKVRAPDDCDQLLRLIVTTLWTRVTGSVG